MDVLFKVRHTLRDSDIKNYRFDRNLQVWSAVFRVETFHKFLLEDIMRAFYPTRGETHMHMKLKQEQQTTN